MWTQPVAVAVLDHFERAKQLTVTAGYGFGSCLCLALLVHTECVMWCRREVAISIDAVADAPSPEVAEILNAIGFFTSPTGARGLSPEK